MGPNAQHDTDCDYVPDFDSRGHPRNIASRSLQRRLLRAQNEALSTVGVVVRKAKASRSQWQTMSDEQKYQLVVEENMTGAYLGIFESIIQKLSTHWMVNLRRRMLVNFRKPCLCQCLTFVDIQIPSGPASAATDFIRMENDGAYSLPICWPFASHDRADRHILQSDGAGRRATVLATRTVLKLLPSIQGRQGPPLFKV